MSTLSMTVIKKEFRCPHCGKQLFTDYYLANFMLMVIAGIFLNIIFYFLDVEFTMSLLIVVVVYTLLYFTIYKFLLNVRLENK